MRQLGNMEADEVVRGGNHERRLKSTEKRWHAPKFPPSKKETRFEKVAADESDPEKLCAGRSPISRDKLNPWLPSSHTPPTPPQPPC